MMIYCLSLPDAVASAYNIGYPSLAHLKQDWSRMQPGNEYIIYQVEVGQQALQNIIATDKWAFLTKDIISCQEVARIQQPPRTAEQLAWLAKRTARRQAYAWRVPGFKPNPKQE